MYYYGLLAYVAGEIKLREISLKMLVTVIKLVLKEL